MKTVEVKVFCDNKGTVGSYKHEGDSGIDLYARLEKPTEIWSGQLLPVPVGISIAPPPGYEGQIRPRSSMAKKKILMQLGTIDNAFRGELCVLLFNLSDTPYTVEPGERIAQLVIMEVPRVTWKLVETREELGETPRGEGGFGSTGRF